MQIREVWTAYPSGIPRVHPWVRSFVILNLSSCLCSVICGFVLSFLPLIIVLIIRFWFTAMKLLWQIGDPYIPSAGLILPHACTWHKRHESILAILFWSFFFLAPKVLNYQVGYTFFYFSFYINGNLRTFTLLFYVVLFLVLYWWWSQDIYFTVLRCFISCFIL
jgi:hypothetical protein